MAKLHVLVGATGSVAIVNLPQYLTVLRQRLGAEVRLIPTDTASEFLPARTAGLFCDDVYTNATKWERGRDHVSLAAWSDIFIVIPATADILRSAAQGAADTLLTSTILACTAPVVFFPNMNAVMWVQPAVQRNVALLRSDGRRVVEPRIVDSLEVSDGSTAPSPVLPTLDSFVDTVKGVLADIVSN